jgi:hypothetical protein
MATYELKYPKKQNWICYITLPLNGKSLHPGSGSSLQINPWWKQRTVSLCVTIHWDLGNFGLEDTEYSTKSRRPCEL